MAAFFDAFFKMSTFLGSFPHLLSTTSLAASFSCDVLFVVHKTS